MARIIETFFTSVGCMDGRVQRVVERFGQKRFGAKYADAITDAGIVGILSEDHLDNKFLDSLRFRIVTVSIRKHKSLGVIVHGHAECAGNPVSDEEQVDDIRRSVSLVKKMVGAVPVIGVFVKRDPEDAKTWIATEVSQTLPA